MCLGHHVHIKGVVEGMEIIRSYTPVTCFKASTDLSPISRLHLLVKVYPDGALTPQLGQLVPGGVVCVSDHTGVFSQAQIAHSQHIYLMAAGTGCTPIFSLLSTICEIFFLK